MIRSVLPVVLCALLGAHMSGCQRKTDKPQVSDEYNEKASLAFKRGGKEVGRRSFRDLLENNTPIRVEGYDPYYQNVRRFGAIPIETVLEAMYQEDLTSLRKHHWLLRAADGYTVPLSGERLLEGGACIAFEDIDTPGRFEPIGPQKANPAPFYLVWSKPTQTSLDTHPRPWQLVSFDIVTFEAAFPHTDPKVPTDHPAAHGYSIFKTFCVRCHAINREGGRVGPDLNVPRSIIEYRPEDQIREYIRNPASFRYGNMPSHLHLTPEDLDGLMAYFRAMHDRPYDPDADRDGGAH